MRNSLLLFLRLASRNLLRNRTRTFLNLTMVIGAFSAIVVSRGFAHYIMRSTEVSFTQGQNGHIQIAKTSIWDDDLPKHKEDAYIEKSSELQKTLLDIPQIALASGRANTFVLLINGDKSISAFALGYDTDVEKNIEESLSFVEGGHFSKGQKFEILLTAGLQKSLHLSIGQNLSVISQTLSGSMSSVDLEVKGVVKTGFADLDNSTVYIPLKIAQKLLGTNRIERIAIILNKDASLEESLAKVKDSVRDKTGLIIKGWKETATFFNQLAQFYSIQNVLVEMILFTLVFFGILNTLGMSIYERIGEIGTLRALGDRTETVLFQIILEGILLGAIGTMMSAPISAFIAYGISSFEIMITLPGASRPMPIHIEPAARDYLVASLVVCISCLIASLWPAQKAVRLSIVDALRANS